MHTVATMLPALAVAWALLHPFPHTPTPAPSAGPPAVEAILGVVLLGGVAAAAWYLSVGR